jgi:hypothetical protein
MSRFAPIGFLSLVSAILAEFCGIVVGKRLGLSQFASVGVGLVVAWLVLYPIAKYLTLRLGGHPLNFIQWASTIAVIVVIAILIHTLIR